MEVAVLGAGAWGMALATVLAGSGRRVWLHSWKAEHAARLARQRECSALPGVLLPAAIEVTHDYARALGQASWVFLVVPTQGLRSTLIRAAPHLSNDVSLVSACKGIEIESLMLVHEVVADVLGEILARRTVHLSGPSFAAEVAAKVPTNLVAAAADATLAEAAQALFSTDWLRVYTSDDAVGVEVGGALKNVIAIAAGACVGLGLGYNAQAALITRGLAEMTRLSRALGGRDQTLAGLSGLGDLILSCAFDRSRNRKLGVEVARGASLADAFGRLGGVAEGYSTVEAVHRLVLRHQVDLPICEEVYQVLHQEKSVALAMNDLMARPLKKEWV